MQVEMPIFFEGRGGGGGERDRNEINGKAADFRCDFGTVFRLLFTSHCSSLTGFLLCGVHKFTEYMSILESIIIIIMSSSYSHTNIETDDRDSATCIISSLFNNLNVQVVQC